jgi:carbon monoxide dehydrogenase subunit G
MACHRDGEGQPAVNFQGSIVLDSPRDAVWELLDDPEALSRCIPGLDGFQAIDRDTFSARVSQTVGPVTAVFAMKLSVLEREPGQSIRFSALGRTTKGAVSHLRATGSVELGQEGHGTRVTLNASAALGGVLGTVGEKVLVKQSEKITAQFGEGLRRELRGGGLAAEQAASAGAASVAAEPPVPAVLPSDSDLARSGLRIQGLESRWAVLAVGLLVGFVLGWIGRRARRVPVIPVPPPGRK